MIISHLSFIFLDDNKGVLVAKKYFCAIMVTIQQEVFMAKDSFTILECREIPALHATGIYAVHKKSGLEVFHVYNNDPENCFSFAFSTPQTNSTGVPHIIEHTVLCGSKNFPLKDPFLTLMQQNLTTFLNAMTFPDKTVFPASSTVEKEYFTLMAVYGDAVFFPLLTRESFEQEGWRFELDETGKASVQGVVFNEMLANYSDFNSVAYQKTQAELLSGTPYEHDSGGNPEHIPDLTYEDFKAFHKKFYHPGNCKVFLYGNIPTEKQLDFLDKKFLQYFDAGEKPAAVSAIKHFDKIKRFQTNAPSNSSEADDKNLVMFAWSLCETQNTKEALAAAVLAEILMGSDAAPLSKAILNSKLGELFSYNGLSSDYKNTSLFFGVTKVANGNEEKVEQLLFDTLQKIAYESLDKKIIETALNKIEFEIKEIIRPRNSPFSLILMQKLYNSWMYGASPFDGLNYSADFETLRTEILRDPQYIQRNVKKLLIENNDCCIACIKPDKNFSLDLQRKINKRAEEFAKNLSATEKKDIRIKQKQTNEAKLKSDDIKYAKLIPHLRVDELPALTEAPKKEFVRCGNIPAIIYKQNTNDISYLTIAIPFDSLDDADYDYAKVYAEALTDMGTAHLSWSENLVEQNRIFGDMSTTLFTTNEPFENFTELDSQTAVQKEFVLNRDWLFITIKILDRFIDEAVAFLAQLLQEVSFDDSERLFDILKQVKNDFENTPATNGQNFSIAKANALLHPSFAAQERLHGMSQFAFIKALVKKAEADKTVLKTLGEKLTAIHKELLNNGILMQIACEEKSAARLCTAVEKNFSRFSALQAKKSVQRKSFCKENFTRELELHPAQIQVAHSAYSFVSFPYDAKTYGKLKAFNNWLGSGPLWENIRMIGGAYGAFAVSFDVGTIFTIITYRDPSALHSLAEIDKILQSIAEKNLSTEEMEKIIVGTYANEVMPKTPQQKALSDFCRIVQGKPLEAKLLEVQGLKETSAADFQYFARLFLESKRRGAAVVLANKNAISDLSEVSSLFDKIETDVEL